LISGLHHTFYVAPRAFHVAFTSRLAADTICEPVKTNENI